jgi:hypothetical protein
LEESFDDKLAYSSHNTVPGLDSLPGHHPSAIRCGERSSGLGCGKTGAQLSRCRRDEVYRAA